MAYFGIWEAFGARQSAWIGERTVSSPMAINIPIYERGRQKARWDVLQEERTDTGKSFVPVTVTLYSIGEIHSTCRRWEF